MSDFVNTEVISVDVLGREFKFKEMCGCAMDKMLDKAMKLNTETGEVGYSIGEQNKAFLSCVVEAPYPEWSELKSVEEKVKFLNRLKSPLRNALIAKIRDYHNDLGGKGDAVKK